MIIVGINKREMLVAKLDWNVNLHF